MPMTPLAALIAECKALFLDTQGVELTNGDIARRSKGRLTRQRVQQLATKPMKGMPDPETIRGLSLGLQVPDSVVLERALRSTGYLNPRNEAERSAPAIEATVAAVADIRDAPMASDPERDAVIEDAKQRLRAGRRVRKAGD